MRSHILLLSLLSLAACGEPVDDNHFANDVDQPRAEPERTTPEVMAVRIGEGGSSFSACAAAGTTRHIDAATGGTMMVRAAPFDTADETGAIPAGGRFFICSRSIDQRWMGVVYDSSGQLSPGCGVSSPVATRRDYDGPCQAGWVPSAFVKLIAD